MRVDTHKHVSLLSVYLEERMVICDTWTNDRIEIAACSEEKLGPSKSRPL